MKTDARRLTGVAIVAAFAVTVAGCSPSGSPTAASNTSASSASASLSVRASAPATSSAPKPSTIVDAAVGANGQSDFCKGTKQAPFTGPAVAKFGAASVMSAYCELVNFSLSQGYTNLMDTKKGRAAIEFSFVKPWMTQTAQKAWDDAVAKDARGDDSGYAVIIALTGYNFENNSARFDKTLPRTGRKTFGSATTAVDTSTGAPRLVLRFITAVDLNYRAVSTGTPEVYRYTKDTTFWLVPNGAADTPWLIDGWNVNDTKVVKVK